MNRSIAVRRFVLSSCLAALPGVLSAADAPVTAQDDVKEAALRVAAAEITYDRAALEQAVQAFRNAAAADPKNAEHPYYEARAAFPLINIRDYQGDARGAQDVGQAGIKALERALQLDGKGNP